MKDVKAIVEESAKSFATCFPHMLWLAPLLIPCPFYEKAKLPSTSKEKSKTNLTDPPNVLISVLLTKPQILIQTKAHVIAIQTVCCETQVEEVLLKRCRDGGFS